MKLSKLLLSNKVRSIHHEILRLLVHRECDDFADIGRVGKEHHHAVDARGDTAVGRCAKLERIVETAELFLNDFLGIASNLERLLHNVEPVVADSARRKLDAVADNIVLISFDVERSLGVKRLKSALRHREGVVREDDLARLGIFLKEREVDDPAELVAVLLANVVRHVVGDVCSDETGKAVALVDIGSHEEEAVAWLHLGDFLHLSKLLFGEELCDRPLKLAFLRPADVSETLAAVLLDECFALVEPSARLNANDALHEKALDEAALLDARSESLEACALEEVGHIEPLERVPKVGLVAAVGHHRIAILDARPRSFAAIPSGELLEGCSNDILYNSEDFVLRGIGHFDIELVEFARAAVGACGFVAEARRDLEVLIEARDHEKLLEHLRSLRQSVEHSAMDSARHEIVARSFGRRRSEDGSLKLVEAFLPHLLAQELDDL